GPGRHRADPGTGGDAARAGRRRARHRRPRRPRRIVATVAGLRCDAPVEPGGMMYLSTVDTELGDLTVVVDGTGTVRAAGFGPAGALLVRLGCAAPEPRADLGRVTAAVQAYFDGDLAAPDSLAVDQDGGPFL